MREMQKKMGVTTLVGFIYFWRKMKPFDHWKEDAVVKFNLNGSMK